MADVDQEKLKQFRKVILKQIDTASGRIKKFVDAEFDYALIREVILLVDRVNILNPEVFGQIVADHRRGKIKNAKGYCSTDTCYNHLLDGDKRSEHLGIEDLLSTYCVSCAHNVAENDTEDEGEEFS